MTTEEEIQQVLAPSIERVKARHDGALPADELVIDLCIQIVAAKGTLAEAAAVMTERIAARLNEDRRIRLERYKPALQAIADESQRHHEHNPTSGIDRLPKGYTAIMSLACSALEEKPT